MANAVLGETYPITVQLVSDSENFVFDSTQITINSNQSYVTVYNSRGSVLVNNGVIFYDPSKLIIGYNWKTTDFSPQEYYTFEFTISITYTPYDNEGNLSTENASSFILKTKTVKALQTNNIFSSNTAGG